MRLHLTRRFWISTTVVLAILVPASRAATITVCADGTGDHLTIQAGIDAAVDGDVVSVCAGTYSGPGNRDIDFGGKAIAVRSSDGPAATVIDCQQLGRGFIFQSGETDTSVVDGFTITNGRGLAVVPSGGAILCVESVPTIRHCVLEANRCTLEGGGLHSELGDGLRVIGCIIRNNNAQVGGGVSVMEGSAELVNCEVTGNTALLSGGGIYGFGADVTCVNCTISGNTISLGEYGSAIYALSGSISLSSSIVWDNPLPFGRGTPISSVGATFTAAYCDIQGSQQGITAGSGLLNWLDGNIDMDPMFEAPGKAPSGGLFGPTGDQVTSGDYRLRPGSPCIDAGDNSALPPDISTDLLGLPRRSDDPDTDDTGLGSAPIVDMGAYELQFDAPAPDVRVVMDIRPGSCPNPLNPTSRGVLPVALLGSAELDVTQIDPATILLWRDGANATVMMVRATLEDVGAAHDAEPCHCIETEPDGIRDLVLKFNMSELVPALGLDRVDHDEPVTLFITGALLDGTTFTTSDCVNMVPMRTK